ncbi:MAG: HEAT repeat domain-containing protein [Candidatus Hydrogenedentes bacterium]|nr:HEAT repeat domain-containing protein [Candidatus Hydrogenedentota bacterium]
MAFLAASALQKARWQPGSPEERAWYLVALQQSREAASLGPVAYEPLVHALQADSTPAFTCIGNTAEAPSDAIEGLFQLEDPRKVDPLIAALKGADAQLALNIANVLGATRAPQAVDALIPLLGHVEASVRASAAEALGKIKDPRAVDPLLALLSETEPSIREYAVIALGEIGDVRAAPALRPFLTEDKGVSTAPVAKALGGIRDPESAPLLAAIALDPEKKDRTACCEALQKIGGPAAQDTFLRLLGHDTDEKVRVTAASLLGAMGDPAAVPALRDAFFFDSSNEVKDSVIGALGRIDGSAAVEALRAAFDLWFGGPTQFAVVNGKRVEVESPVLSRSTERTFPFVEALANNTDPSALDAMVYIASRVNDPTLRFRVAQELVERGDPRAVPMLQDLRNQPETRIDATNTLEKLEQKSDQTDQPSASEQPSTSEQPSATEQSSEAAPENPTDRSDPSAPSDSTPQTSQLAGPRLQFRWVLEGPTLAAPTESEPDRTLAVADEMVLTEGDIASAEVQKDPNSEYFQVLFQTTEDGAKKLKAATEGNLSRKLAIVFDGRVLSAPVVRAPIGSAGAITGNLSEAEAQAIADAITSKKGADSLPEPILYDKLLRRSIEERETFPIKIVDPETVEPKKTETEGAQQ